MVSGACAANIDRAEMAQQMSAQAQAEAQARAEAQAQAEPAKGGMGMMNPM